MEFYSQIADAYDELFPYQEKQLVFVQNALGGQFEQKTILDMGCGTGALAIAMARRSAKVRAFDFDAGMIVKAEEKRPQALDLKFSEGDIRTISNDYALLRFDGVICLGNTLVHLNDHADVSKLFKDAAGLLNPGGKFIFQIVNYDRVIENRVDHLPEIVTPNYQFIRRYEHRPDGKINFNTVLLKQDEVISENQVVLLPLLKSWIEHSLSEVFSEVIFFGGFDGSEWNEDAFHLVLEARL